MKENEQCIFICNFCVLFVVKTGCDFPRFFPMEFCCCVVWNELPKQIVCLLRWPSHDHEGNSANSHKEKYIDLAIANLSYHWYNDYELYKINKLIWKIGAQSNERVEIIFGSFGIFVNRGRTSWIRWRKVVEKVDGVYFLAGRWREWRAPERWLSLRCLRCFHLRHSRKPQVRHGGGPGNVY